MHIQYTVYSIQCTVYSIQYTVYSIQYTGFHAVSGTEVESGEWDRVLGAVKSVYQVDPLEPTLEGEFSCHSAPQVSSTRTSHVYDGLYCTIRYYTIRWTIRYDTIRYDGRDVSQRHRGLVCDLFFHLLALFRRMLRMTLSLYTLLLLLISKPLCTYKRNQLPLLLFFTPLLFLFLLLFTSSLLSNPLVFSHYPIISTNRYQPQC